jgi:hypothetical protein
VPGKPLQPRGVLVNMGGAEDWADVLALEGEDAAIHEGVRGVLADYEQQFRAQEVNRRMKDKAARACHALCRARVIEEIGWRKGTPTAEHLKLVLSAKQPSWSSADRH